MRIEKFIKDNKDIIQNIDGNFDEAIITVMDINARLMFYWFVDGMYLKHEIKEYKW
tara:strand:- start:362 stop:529 length:168 start_codon:yes stop_codon:yes gene_type:complete